MGSHSLAQRLSFPSSNLSLSYVPHDLAALVRSTHGFTILSRFCKRTLSRQIYLDLESRFSIFDWFLFKSPDFLSFVHRITFYSREYFLCARQFSRVSNSSISLPESMTPFLRWYHLKASATVESASKVCMYCDIVIKSDTTSS